jgi:hypothetical protein
MRAQRELRRKVGRSVRSGRPLDDPAEARDALPVIVEQRRNHRRVRIAATALFPLFAAVHAWQVHLYDGALQALAIAGLALMTLYVVAVGPLMSRGLARAERVNRAAAHRSPGIG